MPYYQNHDAASLERKQNFIYHNNLQSEGWETVEVPRDIHDYAMSVCDPEKHPLLPATERRLPSDQQGNDHQIDVHDDINAKTRRR